MKIIKEGELELECPNCRTQFILEAKDYRQNVNYGHLGFVESWLPGMQKSRYGNYVYCPRCSSVVELPQTNS